MPISISSLLVLFLVFSSVAVIARLAIKRHVRRLKIKYEVALEMYEEKKYEKCISAASELLKTKFSGIASNLIGDCYFSMHKYSEAMKYYNESKKDDPENPLNYFGIAEILLINNDYSEAIDNIEMAISLGYDNLDSKITLAVAYLLNRNCDALEKTIVELSEDDSIDFYLKNNGIIFNNTSNEKRDAIRQLIISTSEC